MLRQKEIVKYEFFFSKDFNIPKNMHIFARKKT